MHVKKSLLALLLVWFALFSNLSGEEQLSTDTAKALTAIQFMILFDDTTYAPPPNSIEHTTVTTTEDKEIRVDRIPDGLVFEGAQEKVVLFEIFGHSCPHCINSIPGLNRLRAKYTDKDLLIIAVERYGLTNDELIQYVKDHGITYTTVAKENEGKIENFASILTGGASNGGVPYMMVFSKQGKLVDTHLGDLDEAATDDLITRLLAQ